MTQSAAEYFREKNGYPAELSIAEQLEQCADRPRFYAGVIDTLSGDELIAALELVPEKWREMAKTHIRCTRMRRKHLRRLNQ